MPARSKISKVRTGRRGVTSRLRAEAEVRRDLRYTFRELLAEYEPTRKNEIGKTLLRAIFGVESIAEDSVL